MAYPTVSAPYGYKAVNLIGGQPYAGSTRSLPIQYNYGTAIGYGDPVTLSAGYVVLPSLPVNTTNTIVGYFAGCYYTNPTTKQRLYSQSYPGSVTAGDITAIVVDDPDVVLQVAATTTAGGSVIGSISSILVGQNVAGGTQTLNTSTGDSTLSVVSASTNTANAGFRVLQLVPDTQVVTNVTSSAGAIATATSITVAGLAVGQYIPVGTDLFNVTSYGLQFTGSTVATAVTATSSTSQAITVTAITTAVPAGGTVALVQTPECLVKTNFNVHRYNIV